MNEKKHQRLSLHHRPSFCWTVPGTKLVLIRVAAWFPTIMRALSVRWLGKFENTTDGPNSRTRVPTARVRSLPHLSFSWEMHWSVIEFHFISRGKEVSHCFFIHSLQIKWLGIDGGGAGGGGWGGGLIHLSKCSLGTTALVIGQSDVIGRVKGIEFIFWSLSWRSVKFLVLVETCQ